MTDIIPQFQYSEITGKIIAAAFEVHNTMGCGFQESVYQKALEIEMRSWNVCGM